MADFSSDNGPIQPQGAAEDPLLHYTKLLVRFLQLVFESFPQGEYHWDPDQSLTEIFITMDRTYAKEVNEGRPCIIVKRAGFRFMNLSIDQLKTVEYEDGAKEHTDLTAGAATYYCIAREGLEAQRIAWACAHFTRSLKRSLMRAGFHRIGEEIDIGEEEDAPQVVPDSIPGTTLVRVMVPFFFQNTWTVAPVDKLLLTKLETTLRSERKVPAPTAPVLKGPGLGGKTFENFTTVSLTQRVSTKK